jgi:arsenate reductase
MSDDNLNILFLCTGNSARSILAEAILGREGEGRFKAYSAGSRPIGKVNPYALELLKSLDYETGEFGSKSWDEFAGKAAPQMDFVFTVCGNAAGEVCPLWPGQPVSTHWGMPDPAAVSGSEAEIRHAFEDAYAKLNVRITSFVNIPLGRLDELTLKRELEKIGQGG